MAWTYDPSVSTPKDEVRFMLGDTSEDDQQLQDEEITYLLTKVSGDVTDAAIWAANRLSAKFARLVDYAMGDTKQSLSQLQKSYADLASQLGSAQAVQAVAPFVGGLTITEKEVNILDTDLIQPEFRRDMDINPPGWPSDQLVEIIEN